MVDSAGKKLQAARLQKGITVEEASRVTKMRPERIVDLENDDFTNFPNLTYAKGFLVLYAKYLGVDVSEFTESFAKLNPVGANDYEYLANTPMTRPAIVRPEPETTRRGSPLGLFILIGIFAAGALFWYVFISFQRLGDLSRISASREHPVPATDGSAARPLPDRTEALHALKPEPVAVRPSPPPSILRASAPPPAIASKEDVVTSTSTPPPAIASKEGAVTSANTPPPVIASKDGAPVEVRRAEPVHPIVSPLPGQEVSSFELTVQPHRTTWVKITTGSPDAKPVYDDWLYSDGRALIFKGNKFWVEVRDKDAVQILKNGELIAYPGPGVPVE